ncbi:MAG: archease [Candidatus Woesearchaeota archaeon]|jgi:SHS2 domain-containing protein|nr:archease [Candidatus Woesearchaeota archaeon]MDP7647604.1 archease [Candidatus Woesearchaeota archaeon]
MQFEFLEHTADVKFKCYGKTLAEVFENVVRALSHHMNRGEAVKTTKTKELKVEGTDHQNLLYNFIDEVLYLLDAENFLVAEATVTIEGNKLKATIKGDDSKVYDNLDHIKAATYAEMYVKETSEGWEARAVVDV